MWIARIHPHLHQRSYNHFCAKRQFSYYIIWNPIFCWRYLREGQHTGVPGEKKPPLCLRIGITYQRRKSNVLDFVRSASSAIFWRYLREGEQTGVPEEKSRQPACESVSHIRGENPTSWTGLKPSPSNVGDKLAWSRAGAASYPLSYRPPLYRWIDT